MFSIQPISYPDEQTETILNIWASLSEQSREEINFDLFHYDLNFPPLDYPQTSLSKKEQKRIMAQTGLITIQKIKEVIATFTNSPKIVNSLSGWDTDQKLRPKKTNHPSLRERMIKRMEFFLEKFITM